MHYQNFNHSKKNIHQQPKKKESSPFYVNRQKKHSAFYKKLMKSNERNNWVSKNHVKIFLNKLKKKKLKVDATNPSGKSRHSAVTHAIKSPVDLIFLHWVKLINFQLTFISVCWVFYWTYSFFFLNVLVYIRVRFLYSSHFHNQIIIESSARGIIDEHIAINSKRNQPKEKNESENLNRNRDIDRFI